jgi:ribosomal protein L29
MAHPRELGEISQVQWNTDVVRLEKELASLRTRGAAAHVRAPGSPPRDAYPAPDSPDSPTMGRLTMTPRPKEALSEPGSGSTSAGTPPRSPPGAELAEMFRELEALELALVEERRKMGTLLEDKAASEVSHKRDVAALETMLTQVSSENDKLKAENKRLSTEVAQLKGGYPSKSDSIISPSNKAGTYQCFNVPTGCKEAASPVSSFSIPPSRASVDEPEMEDFNGSFMRSGSFNFVVSPSSKGSF